MGVRVVPCPGLVAGRCLSVGQYYWSPSISLSRVTGRRLSVGHGLPVAVYQSVTGYRSPSISRSRVTSDVTRLCGVRSQSRSVRPNN